MSDAIKHECGLALIRLRKPLEYYQEKYGSALWGLNKMFLLMSKQQNRGQDGAGIAAVKLNAPVGTPYIAVERIIEPAPPWQHLFKGLDKQLEKLLRKEPNLLQDTQAVYEQYPWAGEVLMGHLRYATHGSQEVDNCHPVWRQSNWKTRNLVVAGNFNLTNVGHLVDKLVELGQHPGQHTDTLTVLERIGHFLDTSVQKLFDALKAQNMDNRQISEAIAQQLDLHHVLRHSSKHWDGGYAMGGLLGHGDLFFARDPNGIRPGFYFENDEVVALASERPAIATAFGVPVDEIQEIPRGQAVVVKRDGQLNVAPFTEERERRACTFERIYFSRGSDPDIYQERLALGRSLTKPVLEAVQYDFDRTVFSYIPNTAQVAFWGLLKELENTLSRSKAEQIAQLANKTDVEHLMPILKRRVRAEQVIHKDTKLRTFITADAGRDDMAAHVYDITYGSIHPGQDALVALDDSIVRGTTLKQSILKILSRLQPKTIVIASSAPQIRYPDCYGIDMSQIHRFIAFQAAIALLHDRKQEGLIDEVYKQCQAAEEAGKLEDANLVKAIYAPFKEEEISTKVAELLYSPELNCELKVVYQPLSALPGCMPNHTGDWYFSGNYPTPGGNRVVNRAFLNYVEGRDDRAY